MSSQDKRLLEVGVHYGIKTNLMVANPSDVRNIYCIFAALPFELSDPEYLDGHMAVSIFPSCSIVSYFLASRDNAEALLSEIRAVYTVKKVPWSAQIYVFISDVVYFMPHVALIKTLSGFYEASVFCGTEQHKLTPSFTAQLKSQLQRQGFSFCPTQLPFYNPDTPSAEKSRDTSFVLIGSVNTQ